MTTYTTIPDGDIDQDSPVTQPLMTALRDNPIAIAEGASGAPRINLSAVSQVVTAGAFYAIGDRSTYTHAASSYENAAVIYDFFQAGTVRVYLEHRSTQLFVTSTARVVIDGVVVASWGNNTTSFIARAVDVSVSVGSSIVIQHSYSGSPGQSVVRNCFLGDNGIDRIWPLGYNRWSLIV